MQNKIIIYGGAFNPPTVAHQAIIKAALKYAKSINAELWIMLSGNRSDKTIETPINLRLAYAYGLVSTFDDSVPIKVVDIELKSVKKTQTIDTYNYIKKKYPSKKLIWLFGSDSIKDMPNWNNGDKLLKELNFLVVQRGKNNIKLLNNMVELKVKTPIISSTEVRDKLRKGHSVSGLVPKVIESMLY
jgi:nicotinate-nucleotide adenylyltransferase